MEMVESGGHSGSLVDTERAAHKHRHLKAIANRYDKTRKKQNRYHKNRNLKEN